MFLKIKSGIKDTGCNSLYIKGIPEGCKLCLKGRKSVFFISGECSKNCFFCPLSELRKNKNVMYINEKLVKKDKDIIEEIKKCSSEGVSITGGEPLEHMEDTLRYIKLFKSTFGPEFHIHLYTAKSNVSSEDLKRLDDAGLDEIRFHIYKYSRVLDHALSTSMDVGLEIPVIPGKEKDIINLIELINNKGVGFINLNELEYSSTNEKGMKKHNIPLKENELYVAEGSKETAMKVLKHFERKKISVKIHFCTSSTKFDYQYWNRLKLRAKNIKKPYETLTREGLIEKGVIECNSLDEKKKIIEKLKLNNKDYTYTRKRIETSIKNAKKASKLGFKASIVRELPTEEDFDYEVDPL